MSPDAPAWPGGAGSFRSSGPTGTQPNFAGWNRPGPLGIALAAAPSNPLHVLRSPRGAAGIGEQHGPFVHTLNKGGLQEIVTSGRLRATEPANHLASDRLAVRAHTGSFEHQKKNKNWHGRLSVHIEFMTPVPPDADPPPGWATWSDDRLLEGQLPIHILRVVNGDGELISVVQR